MIINTASYFHHQNYLGTAFCISRSQPFSLPVFEVLFPTKELLNEFKYNGLKWADYAEEYNSILDLRSDLIEYELALLDLEEITLCCWEHNPEHCHRILAANFICNSFDYILGQIR